MIDSVFESAMKLKPGAIISTLKLPHLDFTAHMTVSKNGDQVVTKLSKDGYFEVYKEERYKMSWGRVPVFFLRRTDKLKEDARILN